MGKTLGTLIWMIPTLNQGPVDRGDRKAVPSVPGRMTLWMGQRMGLRTLKTCLTRMTSTISILRIGLWQ